MSSETAATPPHRGKPQRILACILCQQRKVKCDRRFPCANCAKSQAQCVPATLTPRQRRRRFPERVLLDRLRKYEDLLRQQNIPFEPLHKYSGGDKGSVNAGSVHDSDDDVPISAAQDILTPSGTVKSDRGYETKNIYHAMSQGYRDPGNDSDSSQDEVREAVITKAWDQSLDDDHLLFGSRSTPVDLSTLHPEPVQIFRLWQIYLDNVNPLLKVTHTPTLQGQIIEAASNVKNINPSLEALIFSIYCTAVLSLSADDCQLIFGSPKQDLLTSYQFACQQALSNAGFLRTSDRNCLTALYLYLISIRPTTVPHSLCSLLGIAIRIAQRMGTNNESTLARCSVLEAEMRRRLWWSLVCFDSRISELASLKTTTLDPIWDCKIPLNVNDSDLRPELKQPPVVQNKSSEALFIVLRSELGDFVRNSDFYLDFVNPALKSVTTHLRNGIDFGDAGLVKLGEVLEDKYLRFCNEDNPIHFMTIWTTRAFLAKYRLLDHHARYADSSVRQTDAELDAATSHAFRLLECDLKVMTSPLTSGFRWMNHLYFPFPAYHQIALDLRRRSTGDHAKYAWGLLSTSYEAWFEFQVKAHGPFFQIFSKLILQAWDACQSASKELGEESIPQPGIVSSVKDAVAQMGQSASTDSNTGQSDMNMNLDLDDFQMPTQMPTSFINENMIFDPALQDLYTTMSPNVFSGPVGHPPVDPRMNPYIWPGYPGTPSWGWMMNR